MKEILPNIKACLSIDVGYTTYINRPCQVSGKH